MVKGIGLPRPEGLALERNGSRLLAITSPDSDGGKKELRGLDLGSWAGREPILIAGGIEGEVGSVAAGPDRLRLIALTGAGALSAAGGLVEKRTIAYYDVSHQEATLDQALSAAAGGSNRWRIRESLSTLRASPGGVRRVFQWDSGDLRRGGRVVLRVVPYDADRGIESDSAVPRPVLAPLPMRPILLGSQESTPFPIRVFSADLDGDGDKDLAAAGAAIYAFRRRAG